MRPDQLDAGHRLQVAAALVQHELDMAQRLEPRAEARLRLPHALGDGAHPTAVERVEVENAIGFAKAKRAQHHRLGLVDTAGHGSSVELGQVGIAEPGYAFEVVMPRIQMYTTRWCGYCVRAKALLESRGLAYEEISLDDDPRFRQRLLDLTGGWTVPQILIDGRSIGGYTELWQLDRAGELEDLAA